MDFSFHGAIDTSSGVIQEIHSNNPKYDAESGTVTIYKPQFNPRRDPPSLEETTLKLDTWVIKEQKWSLRVRRDQLEEPNRALGEAFSLQNNHVQSLMDPKELRQSGKILICAAIVTASIGAALLTCGGAILAMALGLGLVLLATALFTGGLIAFKAASNHEREEDKMHLLMSQKHSLNVQMNYYNQQLEAWENLSRDSGFDPQLNGSSDLEEM